MTAKPWKLLLSLTEKIKTTLSALLNALLSFLVGPMDVDHTECSIDVLILSKLKLLTTKNLVLPLRIARVLSMIIYMSCPWKGSLPIMSYQLTVLRSEKASDIETVPVLNEK